MEKGGEYAFVSTRGCVNETCPYTVSDDNLKAALDLPSDANDAVRLLPPPVSHTRPSIPLQERSPG